MNNLGSTLPDIDAQRVLRAADALISTVRKTGSGAALLELESSSGEKWRITIERIEDREAMQ